MSTLIFVKGHREIQPTFDRHLPYWQKLGFDIITISPEDRKLHGRGTTVIPIGLSSHHSPWNNIRMKECIRIFLSLKAYHRTMICEYDALCLQEKLPILNPEGVWGHLFTSDQPEFMGHHYLHPPIIMSRDVAGRVLEEWDKHFDGLERCFWDRALGYVCERASIPMFGYGERGYAQNTIEPHHLEAAVAARKAGAIMFHGVKTPQVLNALTQ